MSRCLHCATPFEGSGSAPFCCIGCQSVYALMHGEHLGRYYELRGERGTPVGALTSSRLDTKWIELIERRIAQGGPLSRVDLDVQGLHCTGCIWLLDELFRRQPGGRQVMVNPAVGRVSLVVSREFSLRVYVEQVEKFGYLLGPPLKQDTTQAGDLLAKMGLCIAIAMNSMIFAIAVYCGLEEPRLFRFFHTLNFGLSFVSVVVGGGVFFRSAWLGLRRGYLHLDTPIALGIGLAFAGSTYSHFVRDGAASYFDTLNVFIALMLVGRWLQERVLERNRRFLLASDGIDGLLTRRIDPDGVKLVACTDVRQDDRLLIARGDLVPVDAHLDQDVASCSLDWISGESQPREFHRADTIPAGAFSCGADAIEVRAAVDFSASPLVELLRAPVHRDADEMRATPGWRRLAKVYVWVVLAAASGAFALWMVRTGDTLRALDVVTAVLMVTCPCAFGIATPLAYELVQAGLRRAGLFVRSAGFLDRAQTVRNVVFDKTGTLTTGSLEVANPEALDRLDSAQTRVLYNIAARSTHPKSAAILRALSGRTVAFERTMTVREEPGHGLETHVEGRTYRLGRPGWVCRARNAPGGEDIAFGVDGELLAVFSAHEQLRPDAAAELALLRDDGYGVYILSGDAPQRVAELARKFGVPESHTASSQTPAGKAKWLADHDHRDTLMVGDGINDSLVVERAYCSGTPAIDRPFMAARSDFYFVTPGLSPIRLALRVSHALMGVTRRNLFIAVGYNTVTVTLAYLGLMSPVLCAVLMPLSSLSTVLATITSLAPGRPIWRS